MRTLALTTLLVALAGCSKTAAPTAREATDKDRLRGVWTVESVECGVGLSPQERQRVSDARLHVDANRFALGGGDDWEFYTFGTDTGQEPKRLLLFEATADGKAPAAKGIPKPARSRTWLYKFEGDKLVLAFRRARDADPGPAPADFKAEAGQDVMVLRLARVPEEPRTTRDAKPAPAGTKK